MFQRLVAAIAISLIAQLSVCATAWGGWELLESRNPPLLAHPGVWDLERLGHRSFALPVREETEAISLDFRLPEGARQPRSGESDVLNYLIRANFEIVVSKGSGSGQLILSGSVDGCTGAQIVVDVRKRDGSGPKIDWGAGGLIHGGVGGSAETRSFRAGLTNYLPYCAIQGGPSRLTFQLDRLDGARVSEVRVLPSSGIIINRLNPAHLVLEPETADVAPVVGEPSTFRVEMRNSGDRKVENVGLQVHSSSPLLDVVSEPQLTLGSIGGKTKTVQIRLRPKAVGSYTIGLQGGSSNANSPFTRIEVEVGTGGDNDGIASWPLVAGWLCAVGLVGLLWRRSRRART